MRSLKKYMLLGVLAANLSMVLSTLGAYEIQNNLDFSTGWRRDRIEHKSKIFDSKGGHFQSSEKDKADDLNTWQVGFKGIYAFPDSCCPCGCENFFNNLYLRGSAYWGWGNGGKFHQFLDSTERESRADVDGKSRNVVTTDYDIALGWFFPVTCNFAIAPVVGFNYDKVQWKVRNNHNSLRTFDVSDLDGARFTSKFESPYLGFDLGYTFCNVVLTAGYEYHWVTNFRGSFDTAGEFEDTLHYLTDRRKGHDGWGNVFRIGLNYACNCWDFGIDFKYRDFRLTHGHVVLPYPAESFGVTDPNFDEFVDFKAKWTNYEVNFNFGRSF